MIQLKQMIFSVVLLISFSLIFSCAPHLVKRPVYDYTKMDKMTKTIHQRVEKFITSCWEERIPAEISPFTRIDSLKLDRDKFHIDIFLNPALATIPMREENTGLFYTAMRKFLGRKYKKFTFTLYSGRYSLQELIPNYYRGNKNNYDRSRMPTDLQVAGSPVQNISKPWIPEQGLFGHNVALWHSHGWYYEQKLKRWEWQRARLFQTVEDIGPISFTLPYLVPMLENAGANVFLPRERDIQTHEVIVDNDMSETGHYFEKFRHPEHAWFTGTGNGFAIGTPPYPSFVNPFNQGTFRMIKADTLGCGQITWIPIIPEDGNYAVYISYVSSDSSATDVHYTVYHTGGQTEFRINQQMGGGTWIYLDTFKFQAGSNPEKGMILLSNRSTEPGLYISADAVRLGGGMGNVERDGTISNRPRYQEAARYYLQYAGIPDSLVFSFNGDTNDYKDDYQCRGEWVNYLNGAPCGPNKNRSLTGLRIPIDLSLAFHTDAGITKNDTVIGILSIYSTRDADTTVVFPDKMSRLANRDFADILQTQIVEDIRNKYDPKWKRRDLWDRMYHEAFRPNVPAMLLELLSHQNFLDMKFYQDPRFRFDVSRSIYKAMVKFIATQFNRSYQIQPLPVSHLQAVFIGHKAVRLRWRDTQDPLEPAANADKYILYTRYNNNGFDSGKLIDTTEVIMDNLQPGTIYSFKITAVNAGGESFPSEIVSVCWLDQNPEPVLVINAFDRVSAPAIIETDKFSGFLDFLDQGVADRYSIGYTGMQFNFRPTSKWLDDDAPGFGASWADYETRIIPGNTFDYPYLHGQSLKTCGYSFISASDESIIDGEVDITQYRLVDLILGEEKSTYMPKPNGIIDFKTFPAGLQFQLTRFCQANGNLFLSGAYLGSDLFQPAVIDSQDIIFAQQILHYKLRTDHAVKTGRVYAVDPFFKPALQPFEFNTGYNPGIYTVEAPEAIEPFDSPAKTIFRYAENNMSAAVAYRGSYKVIALGFPFETIIKQEQRNQLMDQILKFLTTDNGTK